MVSYANYQDILFDTNFVGGAGKDDLSTVSAETDGQTDSSKNQNDVWQL